MISKEQVLAANSQKVIDELEGNILSPIIYAILALHVSHSQETTETEAAKARASNLQRMAMMEAAGHDEETAQAAQLSPTSTPPPITTTPHMGTQPSPHTPSPPSVSETHKRKISQTSLQSFPDTSTETTPTKLLQQEADVQNLQNLFVIRILEVLWHPGSIRMPWIRGRVMRLRYVTYIPIPRPH
jgi:hypothetical protein